MDRECDDLLHRIQALQFSAIDLNLFLDTHPDDQWAISCYNQLVGDLKELKARYERTYGPLFGFGWSPNSGGEWMWTETPWPWELQY